MTLGYIPAWSSTAVVALWLVSVASLQADANKVLRRAPRSVNSAPRITRHPVPEVAFRVGEDVTLPCMATSDIDITYIWKKDGQPLTLTVGGKIEDRQGQGSIVIRSPDTTDEGVYQCLARTDFGAALSTKTTLKAAVLESFLTVLNPLVHRPLVGQPLNLSCNPPKNYPTGKIYWGMSAIGSTSSKLEGIDNNDRILLDYNGRLYFANVIPDDSLEQIDGRLFYVCVVHNKLLGKFVKGNEQKVAPVAVAAGNLRNHAPQVMWTSPAQDKAIRGQNKRLKCIFSGLPTPKVSWRRLDGDMSSRVNATPEGHHTEIEIQKVDYIDAGLYECTGTNSEGVSSRTVRLTVESPPYWRQNKVPTDVEVIEDDPAEIECLVDGSPRPTIEWYIDGVPINETELLDERRRVTENRIYYDTVTVDRDKHVFQCSATNEHGQILANMALNIQAFHPSFLDTPMDTKVVQGRNVTLQCRAAGAPRPTITWIRKSTNSTIEDYRFSKLSNGNLEIENTVLEDSDTYECRIGNKFGEDRVAARLLVRRPTVITKSPQDETVNVTDDVTLQCDVTTDEAEMQHLKVFWKKNEDRIDFVRDDRLRMDPVTNSLIIRSAEIDDTAVYTCHADNGLDTAKSGAGILTVRGPPQPPTDVQVRHCSMHTASVTWRPASDNNDPVNEYIVYYNRSHDPSGSVTEATRVAAPVGVTPPMELSASIKVHPWASYTFFVVAVNSLGPGLPSQVSDVCITPQTTPSHNPSGVCSALLGPRQLTIVWEALPREQMNGEGFHYIVGYRLRGKGHQQEVMIIRDPSQTELVIHDQENFRSYEIYVQSANNIGATPLSFSSKRIGYSGEGKPTVIPRGVAINRESLNSTYVELSWNSVDTSEDKMNGFFRGYRIQFWRTDKPEEKRREDIILRPHFDSCPLLSREEDPDRNRRSRRQHGASSAVVTGSTNRLWPNSRIQAGVMALNQANQGNLSQIVEFQTPEGVPGAVSSLEVTQAGSNHLLVEWTPPLDENGILTSYILTCQIAPPHQGSVRLSNLAPTKQSFKIIDLTPSTSYAVSLSAVTSAGQGQILSTIGRTRPQAAPSKPVIGKVDKGDTSANVSWVSSGKEELGNPGNKFYVEYRDTNDPDRVKWNHTKSVTDENWANVTDLIPGRTYEIRVVSVNGLDGNEQETQSETVTVYILAKGERTTTGPKEGMLILSRGDVAVWWFIILMCIIILLLIVLFIICAIYRSRGQMYPVYEKERLWGSPHKADDQPFGEYSRGNPPLRTTELRKSRGSLESDQKPLDSDSTDSLGDYDDADASKFNEDGSFIGIYNSKTRPAPSSARASKRRAAADKSSAANTYV